jgi:hypothetical protein
MDVPLPAVATNGWLAGRVGGGCRFTSVNSGIARRTFASSSDGLLRFGEAAPSAVTEQHEKYRAQHTLAVVWP